MKKITINELREMKGLEGLILRGCGGDPKEWLDGMNEMLTKEKILQNGDTFKEISIFENGGLTNLLFHMDGVDLDVGKLAVWRIATHDNFGGTWFSDYLMNEIGVFNQNSAKQWKPDCPLIGQNGNVFHLMGIASRTLKDNGLTDQAKEMNDRIAACGSYDEALCIMGEYVNITTEEDVQEQDGMEMHQGY